MTYVTDILPQRHREDAIFHDPGMSSMKIRGNVDIVP
jgi:hypothetical protein